MITSEDKAWVKIKESNFCNKMVYEYSTVDFSFGKCSYKRKIIIITDILSYEKRIINSNNKFRFIIAIYKI